MARPAKIWWHTTRKIWCVNIAGKQVRLSTDKGEAQTKFHKLMVAMAENRPVQHAPLLACEVADKFLAWCYKHRERRTAEGYQEHLERFLKWLPNGKTMLASELKPYHVIEYMDDHDWGNSYKRQAGGAIQRVFKWAVAVGLLDFHPCTSVPKPKGGRRETPVSEAEYKTILEHATRDFRDVVEFAWETGARPQEIRTLRPEYIHGDKAIFPVDKSKGRRRSRVIYLNDKAKAIITRRLSNEPDWVFTNAHGSQWTAGNFNNHFDRMKDKIGRKCALYDLRHGYATRKQREGHSAEIIAALMGHQSPQMLHSVYGHIDQEDEHLKRAARSSPA